MGLRHVMNVRGISGMGNGRTVGSGGIGMTMAEASSSNWETMGNDWR
jgi:hypothetical protein